jgi:hypothetical protein
VRTPEARRLVLLVRIPEVDRLGSLLVVLQSRLEGTLPVEVRGHRHLALVPIALQASLCRLAC